MMSTVQDSAHLTQRCPDQKVCKPLQIAMVCGINFVNVLGNQTGWIDTNKLETVLKYMGSSYNLNQKCHRTLTMNDNVSI